MRKVLTFAAAALMVVALVGTASAVTTSDVAWRINLIASDQNGSNSSTSQVGIATNATDGADIGWSPTMDNYAALALDTPGYSIWAASMVTGDNTHVYDKNIMSPASPYEYPKNQKIWNLRVGAMPNNYLATSIKLVFKTTQLLPKATTTDGKPIFFELKMVDNKGIAGAPANETKWWIPIPTATVANTVFWDINTNADQKGVVWGNLPLLKVSAKDAVPLINEGYQMQFRVVPEPSSLLALASGLTGLVGFAIRRRRA